jgi:DNA-3-methyladenine glycosylase
MRPGLRAPDRVPEELPPLPPLAVLPRDVLGRPASEVAPALLGCVLVHDSPAGPVAAAVVETEAYAGLADPASHAFRGPTARTAVMFGPPGHAYVYFSYGMHYCVNLVCGPDGEAGAVLLRAGRVTLGQALAAARRAGAAGRGGRAAVTERELARGPGKLCQALGIDGSLNGADVCDLASPLRICAGAAVPAGSVRSGPRVGVSQAAQVPWRFWIDGEPCVSAYRRHQPRRASRLSASAGGGVDGSMHR